MLKKYIRIFCFYDLCGDRISNYRVLHENSKAVCSPDPLSICSHIFNFQSNQIIFFEFHLSHFSCLSDIRLKKAIIAQPRLFTFISQEYFSDRLQLLRECHALQSAAAGERIFRLADFDIGLS